jgi:RHS repeat-associated protein
VRQGIGGYGGDASTRLKFTGKPRDAETGLDFFGARYLTSVQGRWMTPDWAAKPTTVPYAEFGDPQTLNLYVYVGNRPLSRADADGHHISRDWLSPFRHTSYDLEDGSMLLNDGADHYTLYPANQVAAAQNQSPLSSVTVLGNNVGIKYSPGLKDAERLEASSAIAAAAAVINNNAGSLTAEDKNAIGQISLFSVVGPKTTLGATGKHAMTLSIGYIGGVSAPWLASLFGHEGQHHLNAGKYSGRDSWRDEQSAGRTQLSIGNKIGFTSSEGQFLEQWIDDKNRSAMQQHMEQGIQE